MRVRLLGSDGVGSGAGEAAIWRIAAELQEGGGWAPCRLRWVAPGAAGWDAGLLEEARQIALFLQRRPDPALPAVLGVFAVQGRPLVVLEAEEGRSPASP